MRRAGDRSTSGAFGAGDGDPERVVAEWLARERTDRMVDAGGVEDVTLSSKFNRL